MPAILNQDYKEMLSLLIERKVEFVLVGAYALAVHGFLRAIKNSQGALKIRSMPKP